MTNGDGRGSVRVVGTAHVSAESVEEVRRAIDEEDPDVVAVELDEGRYRQMTGEAPDDIDPKDLLRGSMAFQFLAYWLLSYVQKRMGDRFDIEPGADMMAAVEAAEERGAEVALVDRDIQVTVQRFWTRMGTLEKLRLVGGLALGVTDGWTIGLSTGVAVGLTVAALAEVVAGPFFLAVGAGGLAALLAGAAEALFLGVAGGGALGLLLGGLLSHVAAPEEEVETFDPADLTDTDVVSAMMEEFRRFSPRGAEALIDERDAYLAHNIHDIRERGARVVAVVGAGHEAGVREYLANPETLPPFESLTGRAEKRFSVGKALGTLLTVGFLAFFVLLVMAGVSNAVLLKVFAAWFLFNAVFAAGLALLAGAHPSSAAVGGAVAWLTSLNPLLAPGWFAGYVELRHTRVNISDVSTLNEILADEESPVSDLLARMREVPLFKLIAVVALTNVGSMIASFLFPFVVLPWLGGPFTSVDGVLDAMLRGARNSLDLVFHLL